MADNMTAQQFGNQRAKDLRAESFYNMLVKNEGNRSDAHSVNGVMHIGIGYNLEDEDNKKFLKKQGIDLQELLDGRLLTDNETKTLYNYSLTKAFKDAQSYDPNFAKRPEAVKMTLVDMAFNLGLTKLNKFKKMKAGLMNNDYNAAADEMVDSNWYKQVKSRGPRMVNVMRSAAR